MKNKVLFLDFDGVLFDTLREVYLVNRALHLQKSLFDEVEDDIYALFSKYKYLVYNIWMFYYYNPLVFGADKDIDNNFKKALLNRDREKEDIFCKNFLEIRKNLVLNHYDYWSSLEKPFEFFFKIKEIYDKGFKNIVVVSKKNKISIKQRFESYNFNFDENKIFAREILDKYLTKGEFMAEYMQKENFQSAIFVDDNINNLKSIESYDNIEPVLALWGNTEPDSIKHNFAYQEQDAMNKIENYCM